MRRIAENGYSLAHTRHTVDKRAQELKGLLENFILEYNKIKTTKIPSYGFINYYQDFKAKCLRGVFAFIRVALAIVRNCINFIKKICTSR